MDFLFQVFSYCYYRSRLFNMPEALEIKITFFFSWPRLLSTIDQAGDLKTAAIECAVV